MGRPISPSLLITGRLPQGCLVSCFPLICCERQGLWVTPGVLPTILSLSALHPGQWTGFALVFQPGKKVLPCVLHFLSLASENGGCPAFPPNANSKEILAKGSRVGCQICDLVPYLLCGKTERRALRGCSSRCPWDSVFCKSGHTSPLAGFLRRHVPWWP